MIFSRKTAEKTAELLLQINAIKLNLQKPFLWASGWKSPIYCDNRITLSFVPFRNFLRDELTKNIEENFGKPNVIAAVATGAIGIGMLVAEKLGLPFVYVRPEPKKHGRENQIEGFLDKGQDVVVVEDLVSTGKSSFQAVKVLRENGANVKGMVAIFSYGFEVAEKKFENENLPLFTLSNYDVLIEFALEKEYITKNEQKVLSQWRINPHQWKN